MRTPPLGDVRDPESHPVFLIVFWSIFAGLVVLAAYQPSLLGIKIIVVTLMVELVLFLVGFLARQPSLQKARRNRG